MRKSRFSDEQIIGILKEHQAGLSAAELCRRHCISNATFYEWRSPFGGMEVSDAKRLRALEEENGKLKRLLADAMLDVSTLREMLGKTSDARLEEGCRELGDRGEGLFAASRLRAGRHGVEDIPPCLGQAGRQHAEKQVARDGERAPPLRLDQHDDPADPGTKPGGSTGPSTRSGTTLPPTRRRPGPPPSRPLPIPPAPRPKGCATPRLPARRHFADSVAEDLSRGDTLKEAIAAATARWMGWLVGRTASRETGIPAELPLLTGLATHFEILAEMEPGEC